MPRPTFSFHAALTFSFVALLAPLALGQPVPQPLPTNSEPPTAQPVQQNAPTPAAPVPAPAQTQAPSLVPLPVNATSQLPPNDSSTTIGPIKFGDLTIDAALELLERWTGRTVLRPNALPATTLSLSLNQRVTKNEARQALETLLTMNNIAITPLGEKFLKATPLNTARTESPDFIEGSTLDLPASGRIATKLFQLKFLRIGEFMPQMAGLLTPGASSPPVLFEKANSALVTDTISNLQRVEMLASRLDQPSLEGLVPKFYKVQSTTASELVTKLQDILSGTAASQLGTGTTFRADDRTNQIILMSDARQHPLFDELIERLDTAGESSTRQEVIPLKHANATEVATVLSSLISGQTTAARTVNQQNQAQANMRNAAAAFGGRNQGPQQSNPAQGGLGGMNNANAQRLPGQTQNLAQPQNPQGLAVGNRVNPATGQMTITGPNGTTMVVPGNFGGATAASVPQQFSEILTVVPDERSNSLVVSGTVDDIRLINQLVNKLDVLLAQVRIEVVIAEVTLGNESSSGISALGLTVTGDRLVGFNLTGAGIAVPNATITPGVVGSGPYDLAAQINLLTTPRKTNARILSVPNIITSHNKEGHIFVGEDRPVISSYLNDNTGVGGVGSGYRSTVSTREIGIDLTVKPLIGHDGSVQLEITTEVSDFLGDVTIDGNAQPVVGRRDTASFVSVKSGEILVLGGLQRNARTKNTSRLGPIPIVGDLLGSRSRNDVRTELIFFLRPYVLTNTPADNDEAMRRLETSPQKKEVEAALQGTLTTEVR